jgi:hypothetical protein
MKIIYKYRLNRGENIIALPTSEFKILTVRIQGNTPIVYIELETENGVRFKQPEKEIKIYGYFTGEIFNQFLNTEYIGTVETFEGLVIHFYY